ncbi:MAG: autotransporter-associated beta strand repeat-containing protein [Verrucomicrobiota bacterium]
MKLKPGSLFAVSSFPTALAICLACGSIAHGALFWDGGAVNIGTNGDSASAGGTGTWDATIQNWDAGVSPHVAWTSGNDAVFAGAAGSVTLGTNISAANISISANNYTIATATSAALTLTNGVTTGGNYHQITGAGGLTLSGAQTFDITGGLRVSTFLTGSNTITKNGGGMLSFNNGSNSGFTGKFIVNAGRLGIGSDAHLGAVPGAFVADSITLNGGTLVDGIVNNAGGGFDNGTTGFTINANRGITLGNSGGTIMVGYGTNGRMNVAGVVSGNGSLTKTDGGDLGLYGSNTYAGGTTISGGALSVGELVGNSANEGSATSLGSGAVSVGSGAQLVLAGNNLSIANNVTLNGAATVNNRKGALVGGFQDGGSANTLSGTLTLSGTGDRTVSTWWADKSLTLSGKITGAGTLRIVNIKADNSNGGSVVILSNATNDFTGGITVDSGGNGSTQILRLGASNVIPDGAGAGNLAIDGRLELNGFTDTINGLSGTGVVALGTGGLLIAGNNDVSSNFAGVMAGTSTASLRKIGTGVITLSGTGDNTDFRARVDAGTLVLGKTSSGSVHAVGSQGGADIALVITGGTAQLGGTGGDQIYQNSAVNMTGGNFDFAGRNEGFDGLSGSAGTVTNSVASTTSTLTLGQNNSNGSPVFSGVIENGAGTVALTKTGTGTQTLAGTNTYTGATQVTGGKLVINGSISTSITTVGNTATLAGSGVAGAINIQSAGTLAPGNSIESLGSGNVSFATGSTYAYELDSASPDGDLLYSGGTLDIASGSILTLTELASGTLSDGSKLTLISYLGGWTSGELFTYLGNTLADDSIITLGSNQWFFDYNDTSGGGNFTTDQAGATSFVTMTVVPEPAAALMGGLGMLLIFRRRRD